MKQPVVVILGPSPAAISGVSTHLNLLRESGLADDVRLCHFQVGSEGRHESRLGRLRRLVASPFRLAARLLAEGADLIHINTSLNRGAFWRDLVYAVVARLCGARVVYQVHGGALPQEFCRGSRLAAFLLRGALSLPDVVVVLARCELEAYRAFVPGQQVLLIANAIDPAPFARLTPVHGETQVLRLLYIGRLTRDKGLREAVQALAMARSAGTAATLVLAGSGPDEAELRALASRLGLERFCIFAGPAFSAGKLALFAGSDVLLLPTYAEGLPYALLEAMAAGLPVITTRVGAIPDVVVDGVHGLFVPPRSAPPIAEAITRLAADRPLRTRMSTACRRRIEHTYSLARLAGDFGQLYTALCNRRRAPLLRRPQG